MYRTVQSKNGYSIEAQSMPKRMLILVLAAMAAPAGADTLKEVTAHGVMMETNGAKIDIDFTPDGRFTAF